MIMKLHPKILNLVVDGTLSDRQCIKLGIDDQRLNHIRYDESFNASDHTALAAQLWKGAKGKTHFEVSYMHIGMMKYLLQFFSGETIAHYTGLNRMWLSRMRNGLYADDVPMIRCSLKAFLDSIDPLETEYNARLFSAKRVLQVMHRLGITSKQAAQELDIAEKYVRRCYFEFENNGY